MQAGAQEVGMLAKSQGACGKTGFEEARMVQSGRKGAVRYLVLAIVPLMLSKPLERMGDRAATEAGIGNGAGAPYYIVALLLTVIALGLFLFALKRLIGRIMSKDRSGAQAPASGTPLLTPQRSASAEEPFDPDAALSRYMQNRPSDPPAPVMPAPRPGGFGKKGL
jgi:hypothetical protein